MEASTLTPASSRAGILGRRSPLLKLQGDERLVALIREGHDHAFEALFERYHSRLLAFCRHMLRSTEDAEDVLQEVFVKAHAAMLADERHINVRPWLYRIARNRCLNHLRRPVPEGQDSMDVMVGENGVTTAERVQKREDFRALVADVQDLPETQRTALLLREIDALSYEEIAETWTRRSRRSSRCWCAPGCRSPRRPTRASSPAARSSSSSPRPPRGCARPRARCATTSSAASAARDFRGELRSNTKALAALAPIGPLALRLEGLDREVRLGRIRQRRRRLGRRQRWIAGGTAVAGSAGGAGRGRAGGAAVGAGGRRRGRRRGRSRRRRRRRGGGRRQRRGRRARRRDRRQGRRDRSDRGTAHRRSGRGPPASTPTSPPRDGGARQAAVAPAYSPPPERGAGSAAAAAEPAAPPAPQAEAQATAGANPAAAEQPAEAAAPVPAADDATAPATGAATGDGENAVAGPAGGAGADGGAVASDSGIASEVLVVETTPTEAPPETTPPPAAPPEATPPPAEPPAPTEPPVSTEPPVPTDPPPAVPPQGTTPPPAGPAVP